MLAVCSRALGHVPGLDLEWESGSVKIEFKLCQLTIHSFSTKCMIMPHNYSIFGFYLNCKDTSDKVFFSPSQPSCAQARLIPLIGKTSRVGNCQREVYLNPLLHYNVNQKQQKLQPHKVWKHHSLPISFQPLCFGQRWQSFQHS